MAEAKKIRVLHIITRLDPGGSTTNTLETVARLDQTRFEVGLVAGRTNDPTGQAAAFIERHCIGCVFVNGLVRDVSPFRDILAFFRLLGVIRRGHYDIVHTHSSKAGILGRWAAKLAGVRNIVHTPHGHVFYGYFSSLVTRVFVVMERVTALITTKLIALTEKGIKEHLEFRVGRSAQWVAIPSGIDLSLFRVSPEERAEVRREFHFGKDDIVFASVTRLEPVKNNRTLIEAVGLLVKDHPEVRLLLIGDGAERGVLKNQAMKLGIEKNVVFAGFRTDVARLLNAGDVFVLASLNEGMGRAVIEAMACGLPAIVSKAGGLPEIVKDGCEGYLVAPTDARAWAQAMEKIIVDRVQMASKARERAAEHFSVEVMVKRIEEVYQEVTRQKA